MSRVQPFLFHASLRPATLQRYVAMARSEAVQKQLEKTLADLGTDYIDLYCIHWPVPGKHVAAYQQLEKAMKAGQIRSLGLSNYAVSIMSRPYSSSEAIAHATDQLHPASPSLVTCCSHLCSCSCLPTTSGG